jgi:hypothetical protein
MLYEISFGGTRIHDDTLRDTVVMTVTTGFNAVQLLVAGSDGAIGKREGIAIFDNSIHGTAYAVGQIVNGNRSLTRGIYVHDDSVTLRAAVAGVSGVAFDGLVGLSSPEANNRFEDNSYRVIAPRTGPRT